MGIVDALRGMWGARPSESDLEGEIAWQGEIRRLGNADYLSIPAVFRARQLISSLVSMLEPVAWRNGYPIPTEDQPRILQRPAGREQTRKEWLTQLALSLIDHGNAYLWIPKAGRSSSTGWPDLAYVLAPESVHPEWAGPFSRRYRWEDRWLYPGDDIVHIAIGRPAGELVGRSPLDLGADALGRVLLADLYAAEWFETGSVPTVTLKYDDKLNGTEAEAARQTFMANHRNRSPAVLSKGWDIQESTVSPGDSQLLETRKWGVQEVARVFGIFPAELLLAELSGSSLTYQNIAEALSTFIRTTVQPIYLDALEAGLSDLVPGTQTVRFTTAELERLGTTGRYSAYAMGLQNDFITTEQIDRWEGWDRSAPAPIPPQYAPTPAGSSA